MTRAFPSIRFNTLGACLLKHFIFNTT